MMALLLVCSLPLAAFAEEYDLANGSITVTANTDGQTVNQGGTDHTETSPTVIKQSDSSTPTTNTVTITATENATANVTIQDVNIVISDPSGSPQDHSGQAAVTIDVADNAKANVTLDGVKINVRGTGDSRKNVPGEAAVQITGNGDATIELDGENTVRSGYDRAGVEKNTTAATETEPANGNGQLTITDENETQGSLEATGGVAGAGIGGGFAESGSNIEITGSAVVTAQGGDWASGIGGGDSGSGSNITISGTAEVIAQGGIGSAGIGGGNKGIGSSITITGSAEVTAKGGYLGAGIGGGSGSGSGSGRDITVSQDAQVKAQGGNIAGVWGAGAAIGNGGAYNQAGQDVTPNTDDLNEGWVATYAPGTTDMNTATPDSLIYQENGQLSTSDNAVPFVKQEPTCTDDGNRAGFTVGSTQVGGQTLPATGHSFTNYVSNNDGSKTAKCDHCDATHTIPAPVSEPVPEEVPQTAPLYRVIGQDGKAIACKAEQKGGVLTITVDADFATLTGSASGLKTLKAQGVETIVFETNGAASTFALADLLAQVPSGSSYALTHVGSTVTLTLSSGMDISSILK